MHVETCLYSRDWVPFVGVHVIRALLVEVCIRAPDFRKLPSLKLRVETFGQRDV